MQILEDVIEELEELDRFRRRAAELRDEGQRALVQQFGAKNFDFTLLDPAPILSGATVVKALHVQRNGRVKRFGQIAADRLNQLSAEMVERLERSRPAEIFDSGDESDRLHVLRAARAMATLVTAPDSAFSESVFIYYYVIIREIFTADVPDWTLGGARGGLQSTPSAFVTGECTRAIMGLRAALTSTAEYIEMIAAMLGHNAASDGDTIPEEWLQIERQRAALEFLTTSETQKGNIALKIRPLRNVEQLDAFLRDSVRDIKSGIAGCARAFREANQAIRKQRNAEIEELASLARRKKYKDATERAKRLNRSESAHLIAQGAVEWAVEKAVDTRKALNDPKKTPVQRLMRVAELFREAATETAKILHPAKEFLSRVLDRELAAASAGLSWDAAEMVFAAVAHAYIVGRWDDERLGHAARHLTTALSPRGHFPIGRPIFTSADGLNLHVLNAEALRAFAQLLQHVQSVELTPDLARRMLAFIEDTRYDDKTRRGLWHSGDARSSDVARPWVTATAIYALDRINRMLDTRINQRVFAHFTVRFPNELQVPLLSGLFYPDYGLAQQKVRRAKNVKQRESVAAVLERMRAHVAGVADGRWGDVTWSLILYGPPGTGKTTLAESLAKSCKVPFIEVTPSDIVVAGVDYVERRTRAVFKALSLLTRVVIMFDEFEPVLQKRVGGKEERNVFSFVTPGMLPKLKHLHDMTERRSAAYILNTNLVSKLDDAATRSGRFDARMGIYPPDVLSRAGRLISEVQAYSGTSLTPEMKRRAWEVVRRSFSGPMNTLGKPGWFSKPKELRTGKRNAFEYIFGMTSRLEMPEPEAKYTEHAGDRDDAATELYDWSFVVAWDEAVDKATNPGDLLAAVPDKAAVRRTIDKLPPRKPATPI